MADSDISDPDKVSKDKPTVFISYSSKDREWLDRLLPHLDLLKKQKLLDIWEDSRIDGGDIWFEEIKKAMKSSSIAILLVTADFLSSDFVLKEEVPHFLQEQRQRGMIIIPILIRPCLWEAVPWIKAIQMLPGKGKSVDVDFKDNWDTPFMQTAGLVLRKIQDTSFMLREPLSTTKWAILPENRISIDRLPVTGAELFGRQKEMELLDEAWDKHNRNAISFVAWGGVGKSTLINKWLESMRVDNYRGAQRVYVWSFYSQGTGERATSADLFIAEALKWFGDTYPKEGSPWDKGQRLADLVRKDKTLFILDGLEPLQSVHDFEKGKIKDPALSVLVNELSRENPGLLIITTREEVSELKELNEHVVQKNLEQITPEAGRALLRTAGVRGTDKELEDASISFCNHALALRLLGSYLYEEEGHRIGHASKIPGLEHISEDKGRHPRRVMAAFEKRFGEGPEVELLMMLGLFDRPVEQKAINALLNKKIIPNLTWHFKRLTQAGQKDLLSKLRRLKLIAEEGRHDKGKLDAHPLVREHFWEQLKTAFPDAWREAHSRLYEYFKKQAPELPETIEEMSPLFLAVEHGCAAVRHQDAMYEVFQPRIRRYRENYCYVKLGAIGAELFALSHFFETPWRVSHPSLSERTKAFCLSVAGFDLRSLGRLKEAVPPSEAAIDCITELEVWAEAAIGAGNLSELYLIMGEIERARRFGEKSVELADKSGDAGQKIIKRCTLADALSQAGKQDEVEELFVLSEKMQKEDQPNYPMLYSAWGYRYCDFLLGSGNYQEV
jgi:tetratricopeptide (TPR) repeat protein